MKRTGCPLLKETQGVIRSQIFFPDGSIFDFINNIQYIKPIRDENNAFTYEKCP